MKTKVVALIGNPNSGKTTIFNGLTGSREAVGNWCGVTVEKKEAGYFEGKEHIRLVDLPGIYDIALDAGSADEQITKDYLTAGFSPLIVNVVDAAHLYRQLYLTLQLLEHGMSVVVALNMVDVAKTQGIVIDTAILSKALGCVVVPLTGSKGVGLKVLKKAISDSFNQTPSSVSVLAPEESVESAALRYQLIQQIIAKAVSKQNEAKPQTISEKIDAVVLNRWLGIPIFLGLMYSLFVFAIHITGSLQDLFDTVSSKIFVEGVQTGLVSLQAPDWVVNLLAFGVGEGIHTTVTFIPVIAGMFFALSFLEASGYMARAAFVMDRVMHWAGLPGKSFVPMIIGFGCNVPAVMAARTLDTYRERVLTILMTPFMSCGARLAIYALFVSAFFPNHGQNIIFMLYLIGIGAALLTGFILRKTWLKGEKSALIIELPVYRFPPLWLLAKTTWYRLKQFLVKAGVLIVALCTLLGIFSHKNWLESFGKAVTPIFSPMGIHKDNWPATVGLITGILAKEVVVGTLNALYVQEEQQRTPGVVSDNRVQERFGSTASAFSYLLFVLLYFPCVSVVAVMIRELNKKWAIFSVIWTTGFAYCMAVLCYQTLMIFETPVASVSWILGILGTLSAGGFYVYQFIQRRPLKQFKAVPTPITLVSP